jgi:hypothetical protein
MSRKQKKGFIFALTKKEKQTMGYEKIFKRRNLGDQKI